VEFGKAKRQSFPRVDEIDDVIVSLKQKPEHLISHLSYLTVILTIPNGTLPLPLPSPHSTSPS
jgi:hypothetical protein